MHILIPSQQRMASRADLPTPPGPQPSGRLERTWMNKHFPLLAHDDGSYEWLDQSDYRVAEESNPSCEHERHRDHEASSQVCCV